MKIATAFAKTIDLFNAEHNKGKRVGEEGFKGIQDMPDKVWIKKIDNHWAVGIHVNQGEERTFDFGDNMQVKLKAGYMAVWYNGWLASIMTPAGGAFVGGEEANEDTFIKAIEEAIKNENN